MGCRSTDLDIFGRRFELGGGGDADMEFGGHLPLLLC